MSFRFSPFRAVLPRLPSSTLQRCRTWWLVSGLLAGLLLGGCSIKESTPIKIGFVGSLTGRIADLGVAGRNGAQLAIEEVNAAGGIDGRKLEFIAKDVESSSARGESATRELIAEKVVGIIGPMTSVVAMHTVPIANEAKTLMISGTVTTTALSGHDDFFFRVVASTTEHAATMAKYLSTQRKVKHVALLVNMSNRSYSESWAQDFQQSFLTAPDRWVERVDYAGGEGAQFDELARQLLARRPDAVILVTNPIEAAHMAGALARRKSTAIHATSEWAGTGKLNELGGANAEGLIVPLYFDLKSQAPAYQRFTRAYQQRYQQSPSFPAILSYTAAQVLIRALREQQPGEDLKQTVLRVKSFVGLQGNIDFDAYGDVQSPTYLTVIRNGQYEPLP